MVAFSAASRRHISAELPEEDKVNGEEMVGEFNSSMCGARHAAHNWGGECASTIGKLGFRRGAASPCTFNHPTRTLKCYMHGRDFATVGLDHDLKCMKGEMGGYYELKTQAPGPDNKALQQVRVPNRVPTCAKEGINYEADPRQAGIVIEELGLKYAKRVMPAGTKDEGTTKEDHGDKLDEFNTSKYRAIGARPNCQTSDRPDIACSVKELARSTGSHSKGCQ